MTVYTLTRVSTDSAGGQATGGNSEVGDFSANGALYVFDSGASNLVAGDTNGVFDIFLKTLSTGALQRVSTDSLGGQLNGTSFSADFLDSNRFAFESQATNAVAGDVNGVDDIVLKNLSTGALTAVSASAAGVLANAGNGTGSAFNDNVTNRTAGDLVVFQSGATNLTPGDANNNTDIFVKNVATGAITLVSTTTGGVQSLGSSNNGRISPDGNLVIFDSTADDLVPADTNVRSDVFLKNLTTGVLVRISLTAGGLQSNGTSRGIGFSPDGTKVLFLSDSTDLVPGDTNGVQDVFIKTLATGAIERVSTDANGGQLNGTSAGGAFSPDGTKVIFASAATNAVAGDTNGVSDVFIKTLGTGAIERLVTPTGDQFVGGASTNGLFSPSGSSIVFQSTATNVVTGDTNGVQDIFLAALVAPAAPPSVTPPATTEDNDGASMRGPTFNAWFINLLRFSNPGFQPLQETVVTPTGQVLPNPLLEAQRTVAGWALDYANIPTDQFALDKLVDMADATTTVALMNYQFFTGKLPSQLGLDFLVNSNQNTADLNDGYYAGMAVENRYINFAVNLGKLGEGQAAFSAAYGNLSLADATTRAYTEIFGVAPAAGKVADILNGQVSFAGRTAARSDYLTALGGDALGAKAAAVGFLLSEAAKSDVGAYSVMIENFLYDLSDGSALFGIDAHAYLGAGPRALGVLSLG